jgi:antitoxin MazE
MKTKLVRIGNSRGVRLPRPLIDAVGFIDEVEVTVEGSALILRPATPHPREGWEEAFRAMHSAGDDQLLDEPTPTEFDESEWEWPQ